MNKADLRIAFIGAGNIAHSLAVALHKKKYKIVSVISRKKSSAKSLADKVKAISFSDNINEISKESNLFFLSVPDDQLKKVASELSKQRLDFKGSAFIHLSGIKTINELKVLERKNGKTGSIHLMQTFPNRKIIPVKNSPAAIETKSRIVKKVLFDIASVLELNTFEIKSDVKEFYHLAGVFSSNFLVGNLFASQVLLNKTEIKKEDFFNVIETTLMTTIKNIKNDLPENSLSGPVERGDVEVIKKHINVLKKDKTLLQSYLVQTLNLLELIKLKKNGFTHNHFKIKEILTTEFSKI